MLQVKTERLTPDNNSRCVTPLSTGHPGTPPSATTLTAVPESATTTTTTAGQHHLKHVEQIMMGRSYTEFMRSLAAKYNSSNPSEYVYIHILFYIRHVALNIYIYIYMYTWLCRTFYIFCFMIYSRCIINLIELWFIAERFNVPKGLVILLSHGEKISQP